MLDRICITCHSKQTPIKNIASIQVSGPAALTIETHDKSYTLNVSKAIMDSDLGIVPSVVDEKTIKLNMPPLTEDRRKEFAKSVKTYGEECKVAIRNIRRDAVDVLKKMTKSKEYSIGKDQEKKTLDALQKKLTETYTKKIDTIVDKKTQEIMKI
jgi:ribosome recycling factor